MKEAPADVRTLYWKLFRPYTVNYIKLKIFTYIQRNPGKLYLFVQHEGIYVHNVCEVSTIEIRFDDKVIEFAIRLKKKKKELKLQIMRIQF